VAPNLTVRVQDAYASQAVTSATQVDGRYAGFRATLYLKGVNSGFASRPDDVVAHEYGHVWTMYHFFLSQQGDWGRYLQARGLTNDPRLDTSYTWDRGEIIADDYRLLFGTAAAIEQRPTHLNSEISDPRAVAGLRSFFLTSWAANS
jgi:hypothetical protein